MAALIGEHGRLGAELTAYFGDIKDARAALEDRYLGVFASLADYMQELTEETIVIPEPLRFYIDWERLARDAEMSGDVLTIRTGHTEIHIFTGC